MSQLSSLARLVGVATVATVMLVPAAGASSAPSHPFRVAAEPPGTTGGFALVTAVPHSSDAWAFGTNESDGIAPLLGRYHDGKWSHIKIKLGPYGSLGGIAAGSAKVVWADGASEGNSLIVRPLLDQWHGKTFKPVKLPAHLTGSFAAIAASSASNAWAVGSDLFIGSKLVDLHWNGKKWSAVVVSATDTLTAVSTSGPRNAWAISGETLVHWNGKKWANSIDVPASVTLRAIATSSSRHAYAVGYTTNATTMLEKPYILRYNGHKWSRVAAPRPYRSVGLLSVTMHGSAAWAVAQADNASDLQRAVILHTVGGKWKVQKSPVHGLGSLVAVSAESASRVYVVGNWRPDVDSFPETAFAIYNGHSWRTAPSVV
jgi:hypothetical protein